MYEQGVIRPPSEANSLLLRVTRNCPWNQCLFCPAFKGVKFSKRTVEEVKKDIDAMAREYNGHTSTIRSLFLQDGDSLILPTADVLDILAYAKEKFPDIGRITTYARATTIRKKTPEEMRLLREAGLSRIHMGLESGSPTVLKLMKKGISPEDITISGRRVVEAGISLSEYIIPGLGGKTLTGEHAHETARLLNIVRPDFIRVRSFALHPQSPINRLIAGGKFVLMNDEETIEELRRLVVALAEMHSYFSCGDYGPNLLMDVDGYLDEKKGQMLAVIDGYLSLDKRQKQAYSLLRRTSYVRCPVSTVQDPAVMEKMLPEIQRLDQQEGGVDGYIRRIMSQMIPQPQTEDWK
ncbi:MAG: radical SAM protein [Pseudomonadota bacterium]